MGLIDTLKNIFRLGDEIVNNSPSTQQLPYYLYQYNDGSIRTVAQYTYDGTNIEEGQLLVDWDVITDLSKLEQLYNEGFISYVALTNMLDVIYFAKQSDTNFINQFNNKRILYEHNIVGRNAIMSEYGSYGYELINRWHERKRTCRKELWNIGNTYIRLSLDIPSQLKVLNVINKFGLEHMYIEYGIDGKNYDNATDGIADFIEGTNAFTGRGFDDLQLTTNVGYTLNDIKSKLINLLVYGNKIE